MKKIFVFIFSLILYSPLHPMKRFRNNSEPSPKKKLELATPSPFPHPLPNKQISYLDPSKFYDAPFSLPRAEKNQFLCNNCDRSFSTKYCKQEHEKSCSKFNKIKKPFKSLSREILLKKESPDNPSIEVTSKLVKDKKKICPVCRKTLCNKNSLKKHMMLHTGERPYKCQVCSKEFIQISNFKNHAKYCIITPTLSKNDPSPTILDKDIHQTSYSSDDEKSGENGDLIEFFNNEDLSEWLKCL